MEIENKILAKAAEIRGQFINHVAFIEKQMEIFIAYHFCKDEDTAYEMMELLTGDRFVAFESKRTVFENIMKRHRTQEYLENKDKFEALTTIQTQRNRLAHLITLVGPVAEKEFIEKGSIGFVKFAFDKTKPIWYDAEELKRISEAVNIVSSWFNTIK